MNAIRMTTPVCAWLLTAFAAVASPTFDIGEHFAKPEAWEESAVDFTVNHQGEGFKFASQKRDIVNSLRRGESTWHGLEVWEAKVYYVEDKPARVELSLYNRGDDREGEGLTAEGLQEMLRRVNRALAPSSKALPSARKTEVKGGSRFTCAWLAVDPKVELTWGVIGKSRRDSEVSFVRAVLMRKGESRPVGATKSVSGLVSKARTKANVRREADGDVWIPNVPMVDQGQKGYCAVAVSERVLRYFGYPIDEHELAQVAGSTSEGGTSTAAMKETVRAVGSKCRLGFNEIVSLVGSLRDVEKDLDQYNKVAKTEGERQLSMAEFTRGHMIDVGAIMDAMKPGLVKKMRAKDSRFKKFLAGVKAQIDQGNPILWAVSLGRYPEPEIPQARGGHMRLIIGYNTKTREVIYTDTWGAGHERKRMPEDWAFAITHDAFFLRPL